MQRYDDMAAFYGEHPELSVGWGSLSHTAAPGGLDTAFQDAYWSSEETDVRGKGKWLVTVAIPQYKSYILTRGGLVTAEDNSVEGAVVATNRETGEVVVLTSSNDIRKIWQRLTELEHETRWSHDLTLEHLTAEVTKV